MRPSSVLAVAVSAALGIGLGIVGGSVLDRGPDTFADPLALGIPYRNVSCDGRVLLTVGRGSASQVGSALAAYQDLNVSYLATNRSCPTIWTPDPGRKPPYVAYVGPFGNSAAACDTLFRAGHGGGIVTVLKAGTPEIVPCLCHVKVARPLLRNGSSNEGTGGVWIRQLQRMLIDMGVATKDSASGSYDASMAAEIRDFQRHNHLGATGEVDDATWSKLLLLGCRLYTT